TSEAKHGRLAAIYRLISLIWSGNGSQPFWRLLPSLHQLSEFFNGSFFYPSKARLDIYSAIIIYPGDDNTTPGGCQLLNES
ncbi:MAG: hypothetical protein SF339_22555, partial [Blastocatellia bacterium]|nr:hypothetical protein [Blastocatellia bacterium]